MNTIEFHDQNFRGIELSFAKSQLVLEFDLYDELNDDYNEIRLVFNNISQFSCDSLAMDVFSDLDILSLDFVQNISSFTAELVLSLGFGKTIFRTNFTFSDFVVHGNIPASRA